jgi:hypothetical protein
MLVEEVMFAAMLFAISITALTQFAVYYWRAVLSAVAAQPISVQVLESAAVEGGRITAGHFEILAELHDLTVELSPYNRGIRGVRAYHAVIHAIGRTLGAKSSALAAWVDRERAICARYAAVQIDRRLQDNLALAASLRSC